MDLAEGNMTGGASESPWPVPVSRRPQTRPRNSMHEKREASGMAVGDEDSRLAGEGEGRTARPPSIRDESPTRQ